MSIDPLIIEMGASVEAFARECFQVAWKVPPAQFHKDLYRDLDNDNLRELCIVAPRGHAKTTITATIFPLHRILFSHLMGRGHEFIVIVSKTSTHAEAVLASIKNELDTNDYIRAYFGEWGKATALKWNENEITLKNNSTILALGMGSQFNGLIRFFQRPTLFILDDPEDAKNASTLAAMKQNMNWFEFALMAGRDPKRSRVIVIGTMINDGCMVDRFSKSPEWHHRWYKAIPDRDGVPWDGDENNKWPVLWEDWLPFDQLMKERRRAASNHEEPSWWMNYQNEFRTGDNQPFKKEYFNKYRGKLLEVSKAMWAVEVERAVDHEGEVLIEKQIVPVNVFWGYDPASSLSSRADETGICFWGMDHRKNLFLLWKFHARIDPLDAAKRFYEKAIELRPIGGNVETVQAQETIRSYLRDRCSEEGTCIPGIQNKNQPRAKKSERLISNLWRFQAGKIFVREGIDDDLIAQYTNYIIDKEAQHEDMLDADYYAFLSCYPCDVDWTEDENELREDAGDASGILGVYDYDEEETTWMSE